MICQCCREEMKCVDDVNDIGTRIDWMRCPKCDSFAEIIYDDQKRDQIDSITWKRNYDWDGSGD